MPVGSSKLRKMGSDSSVVGKYCPQQQVPCMTCPCSQAPAENTGVYDDIIQFTAATFQNKSVSSVHGWGACLWKWLGQCRRQGLWKGTRAMTSATAPNRIWGLCNTGLHLFPTISVKGYQLHKRKELNKMTLLQPSSDW